MKLTKAKKRDIFELIINDIPPDTDYEELIQRLVWEESFLQLPDGLRAAIKQDPGIKNFLSIVSFHLAGCYCLYIRAYDNYIMSLALTEEVKRLHSLRDASRDNIRDIKISVWAMIDACSTVKQFADSYPEFAKYISPGEPVRKDLPAANTISKMTSLGWPKK